MEKFRTITEEEVEKWCEYGLFDPTLTRLTELLNGEYSLNEARRDVLSFREDGD